MCDWTVFVLMLITPVSRLCFRRVELDSQQADDISPYITSRFQLPCPTSCSFGWLPRCAALCMKSDERWERTCTDINAKRLRRMMMRKSAAVRCILFYSPSKPQEVASASSWRRRGGYWRINMTLLITCVEWQSVNHSHETTFWMYIIYTGTFVSPIKKKWR